MLYGKHSYNITMAADEDIILNIEINSDKAGKSLKQLRTEYKDQQKELSNLQVGTKAYIQQLEKLGAIKDDIGDLNAEIAAFNPEGKVQAFGNVIGGLSSGFQAAQGAMALFGKSGEDVQKVLLKVQAATAFAEGIKGVASLGDGFKVLSNIIRANPIMLLATVLISVGTALFALKDKVDIIGKAFDYLSESLSNFTDWLGITSKASDSKADRIIKNAQKEGQAVSDRYDREIERAKAAGKETFDLERKKQEAIIQTLRVEGMAIVAAAKARGKFTEEENKRFTELIAATQKASDEIAIINITETKKHKDELDARNKDYSNKLEKDKADKIKHDAEMRDLQKAQGEYEYKVAEEKRKQDVANYLQGVKELEDAKNEAQKIIDAENADRLAKAELDSLNNPNDIEAKKAMLQTQMEVELENTELTENQKLLIQKKYSDQLVKIKEDETKRRTQLELDSLNAAQNLSDIFFSTRLALANGNAEAELKIKKQQFAVDKAFAISKATIDGIRSVVAANTIPPPLGTAYAVFAGIAAAANVAKIASTKFNGGGATTSTPTVTAPNISSSNGVPINTPASSTRLNNDGTVNNTPVQKVYVVETDIKKTSGRVASIEGNSKYG